MSFGHLIRIALDRMNLGQAVTLINKIGDEAETYKIHSLFDREGMGVVRLLKMAGAKRLWIDLKIHDTPDTVRDRAAAVKDSGADILTVHASGGVEMMRAAVEAGPAEILAVTLLTSLADDFIKDTFKYPAAEQVLQLGLLAKKAGVSGLVCSAHEVKTLASHPDLRGMKFVVPGIRKDGSNPNDQKRVESVGNAFRNGATDVVAGRIVTEDADPLKAFDELTNEIASVRPQTFAAAAPIPEL